MNANQQRFTVSKPEDVFDLLQLSNSRWLRGYDEKNRLRCEIEKSMVRTRGPRGGNRKTLHFGVVCKDFLTLVWFLTLHWESPCGWKNEPLKLLAFSSEE